MVIFDTSLIVDASRKRKYALDLIESYSKKEKIATTIITKYEMLRGAPEQYSEFVSELLERFIILDFGNEALDEAVNVYKNLKEKGKMINELDIMIAGIATANHETLITKDKDFLFLESNKITVLTNT
jgi:predicted nucleic acid-binding protein